MYTIAQLAEIMCVSKRTIYRMLVRGDIPCVIRFGWQWRFPKDATDKWLSQTMGPLFQRIRKRWTGTKGGGDGRKN